MSLGDLNPSKSSALTCPDSIATSGPIDFPGPRWSPKITWDVQKSEMTWSKFIWKKYFIFYQKMSFYTSNIKFDVGFQRPTMQFNFF